MILQRINYIKILKIAIGGCLAVVIADFLHLSYGTSAGVITLLTIFNTKKETLLVTAKRFAAFFIVIILSGACFFLVGYNPAAIGLFLFCFTGACYLLNFQDAIAMNTVLMTHFYIEQSMSFYWIRNEFLLIAVGAGIGVLINLYMPANRAQIRKDQRLIEGRIKLILIKLADLIESGGNQNSAEEIRREQVVPDYKELETLLRQASERAYANMENTLLSDTHYYIQYIDMRDNQFQVLKQILEAACRLTIIPSQGQVIAAFIKKIEKSFHEYNNVKQLLLDMESIQNFMREEPLPASREEFENRAVLYRIMYELQDFLLLKRNFVEQLDENQILHYWEKKI